MTPCRAPRLHGAALPGKQKNEYSWRFAIKITHRQRWKPTCKVENKNPNGHKGKGSIVHWDCHQSPPAVCVSGGSDGMLVPCQEKRSQGKTKAELDETKPRCWKILWPVTVESREGNVHREAHEITQHLTAFPHQCTPYPSTHMDHPPCCGHSFWHPTALTASGLKKNLNRNLLHSWKEARALPQDCKSSRTRCAPKQLSELGKNWPSKPSKNCFLSMSFSLLLWAYGKSLTAAPKLWQFVVFIVSCCLCWWFAPPSDEDKWYPSIYTQLVTAACWGKKNKLL